MADPIQFDRKPYIVSYIDMDGNPQKIRRVPPPKLHDALPTDKVELSRTHSDDFERGDVVTVKTISPRQPNTLKVENADGKTVFIGYNEMFVKEKMASRDGTPPERMPERSKYLLWP
jgi:hypothetical protein